MAKEKKWVNKSNYAVEDRYKKLSELVRNTHKEKPKPEDLAALRRFFDEDPELWRATGNIWLVAHWIICCGTYYPQSAYVQECVNRRVQEMRTELGYAEGRRSREF